MSEYADLMAGRPVRRRWGAGRPREFEPEVAEARRLERGRRNTEAKRRARVALELKYPTDAEAFYAAALAEVNAERGPLPGDPT